MSFLVSQDLFINYQTCQAKDYEKQEENGKFDEDNVVGQVENEKQQLQGRRLRRRRPTTRWKKCNPVRKKKTEL